MDGNDILHKVLGNIAPIAELKAWQDTARTYSKVKVYDLTEADKYERIWD